MTLYFILDFWGQYLTDIWEFKQSKQTSLKFKESLKSVIWLYLVIVTKTCIESENEVFYWPTYTYNKW